MGVRLLVAVALAAACASAPGQRARQAAPAAPRLAAPGATRAARRPLEAGCALADAVRSLTPSSSCLACHDGSVGAPRVGATEGCHPTAVRYEEARRAGRTLRPRGETPPEIVLVGGEVVACTSCHDGGSRLPHHLALPLQGSALCLACHPRD